ncbi:hypothetical protein MTR_6g407110 [Medicago truncatula]|uniref:Uncharacterized protein n=1 Tax=Medicago truncatula TaxID=3880 RepID=A0A072U574_MEDTR|nr:hypothetical protein MTR_6g407110 [Medicago truncatula]
MKQSTKTKSIKTVKVIQRRKMGLPKNSIGSADVTLVSSPSSSVINIFSPSLDVTLETITYNCP